MVLSPVYYISKKKNNPKDYLKLKNLAKVNKAKKILKLNNEKDFLIAKSLLEEAQDYHEAKVGLAIIYFRGYGYIKTDHLKSKNLLMKALEQGNIKASFLLFYYFGDKQEVRQRLGLVQEENLIKFRNCIQKQLDVYVKGQCKGDYERSVSFFRKVIQKHEFMNKPEEKKIR